MIIKTKIEFEFNTNDMDQEFLDPYTYNGQLDVPDLCEYAVDCMVDDLYTMVKYNEIRDAIRTEIINA